MDEERTAFIRVLRQFRRLICIRLAQVVECQPVLIEEQGTQSVWGKGGCRHLLPASWATGAPSAKLSYTATHTSHGLPLRISCCYDGKYLWTLLRGNLQASYGQDWGASSVRVAWV